MTNKELFQKHGITITNSQFRSHMLLAGSGIRIDTFTINWPGNKIDGQTVIRQTYTPRKKMQGWGKGEYSFMLEIEPRMCFDTIEQLVNHYAKKH